ncbi:MAG: hypothetical protein V4721_14935 [Bacteroidota bacterium]
MSWFCTKCGNNWAALHSIDEGEESYEFCPLCRTDSFLVEGTGKGCYITLDNKIIDVATGKEVMKEFKPTIVQEREPYYLIMQRKEREMQEREDRAMEAYHSLFESDMTAAKQAYKQIISKQQ